LNGASDVPERTLVLFSRLWYNPAVRIPNPWI
jgi:hypothetical protein